MQIKANSTIAFRSAIAQFAAPGKLGFSVDQDQGTDVTIFGIDKCDHCGCDCRAPNDITMVGVRDWGFAVLAARKILAREDVCDELGANDDGDAVCPACYAKQAKAG